MFERMLLTQNAFEKFESLFRFAIEKHSFEQLQNTIFKQFKIILKFLTSSSSSSSSSKISMKTKEIVKKKSKKFFNMNIITQNFNNFITLKINKNFIQIINESIKYLIQNLNAIFFFRFLVIVFAYI